MDLSSVFNAVLYSLLKIWYAFACYIPFYNDISILKNIAVRMFCKRMTCRYDVFPFSLNML